ncbi:MAG: thermonuclease family protein [Methanobrevibacter sp.]|uniref:thermonuclease family protein n=1 Tax=Methanobrevibacter sp. TaxID=66852 RepID=UPI0025FDB99A|nr:thermonuclease family protein [Methanobrevibacter sp.]MBQ6100013.1 thermonuclease family protein [Methanobrevibacter sp.]
MNKQKISLILLTIFLISVGLTLANALLQDNNTVENKTGTLTISNKSIQYENAGKCVEVIDGNTIQVYGIGKVQLVQVKTPDVNESGFSDAKKFVEDKCLGKTVYLDIDDLQPEDKYGRTLAIVYTDTEDINKELIDNGFAKISYFEPSEFKKGEI